MSRYTEKLPDGRSVIKKEYSFTTNSAYGSFIEGKAVDKLAAYEDAEEQGVLRKLPCNIGDTVYILAGRFGTFYEEDICDGFFIGRDGVLQVKVKNEKGNHGTYGVVGTSLFLTQNDAENAIANRTLN